MQDSNIRNLPTGAKIQTFQLLEAFRKGFEADVRYSSTASKLKILQIRTVRGYKFTGSIRNFFAEAQVEVSQGRQDKTECLDQDTIRYSWASWHVDTGQGWKTVSDLLERLPDVQNLYPLYPTCLQTRNNHGWGQSSEMKFGFAAFPDFFCIQNISPALANLTK